VAGTADGAGAGAADGVEAGTADDAAAGAADGSATGTADGAVAGGSADSSAADIAPPYFDEYILRVHVDDHGGAHGAYRCVVWAFDDAGQEAYAWSDEIIVPDPADSGPPEIAGIEVEGLTADGFFLVATVTDDSGVTWTPVGVFTEPGWTDDLVWANAAPWDVDAPEAGGRACGPDERGAYVSVADHGGARGPDNPYRVILWAYDANGHESYAWGPEVIVPEA